LAADSAAARVFANSSVRPGNRHASAAGCPRVPARRRWSRRGRRPGTHAGARRPLGRSRPHPHCRRPRTSAVTVATSPAAARPIREHRHIALAGVLQARRQPDVEGQHHVAALEVLLAAAAGRVGDDPPTALGAVHVPDAVTHRADQLGRRLLQLDDVFVGLVLHECANRVLLTFADMDSHGQSERADELTPAPELGRQGRPRLHGMQGAKD
jgi:hypothetical protein